ncbi:MAG: carboxypeptidase-like regulatory domain-containing protein [Bacteroidales bacterium]|nr:carboxypeptidase-like regulatory domain-containing protein [Bacteroidales bacterium]
MRNTLVILWTFFLCLHLSGQQVEGRILDSRSNIPLEYANIGIIGTRLGTITDQQGVFHLEAPGQDPESTVRISMIGYKTQTFTLAELRDSENLIRLEVDPIPLAEVSISPLGEPYKIGTTQYNRIGNFCGWGGSRFGKGHEIGTKMDLGDQPVHIRKLHVHVHRQAYDTIWFRFHIRSLKDDKPFEELLTSNVILAIEEEKGWVELYLDEYRIVQQGEVAISLEWLKISGINEDRAMKINDKITSEYLLFNTKKKQGIIYTKWGVEGKWNTGNEKCPAMHLTVQR